MQGVLLVKFAGAFKNFTCKCLQGVSRIQYRNRFLKKNDAVASMYNTTERKGHLKANQLQTCKESLFQRNKKILKLILN